MKERLSELMDDEIADDEVPTVVDALATEPELQQAWEGFRFASDALRAHLVEPPVEVVAAVMAAIGQLGTAVPAGQNGLQKSAPADEPPRKKPVSL